MDTDLYRECTFAGSLASVPEIEGDIRDAAPADLEGFDAVIHLAALSNDRLGDFNPELTYDINHRATTHFARLARDAGVERFLFSSSCSNYGAGGDDMLDETRLQSGDAVRHLEGARRAGPARPGDEGLQPRAAAQATAYGVSPRLRCDVVLNNLTVWAVATGKVLIKSDGTPWRPIVHVEDITRAFVAALRAPARRCTLKRSTSPGRQRTTGSASCGRSCAKRCRVARSSSRVTPAPTPRNYRVDASKIASTLPEFTPVWTARQGAEQLYEAFKEVGITVDEFEGWKYRRIGQIKQLMESGRLGPDLRWT